MNWKNIAGGGAAAAVGAIAAVAAMHGLDLRKAPDRGAYIRTYLL
jgi:hypothetical protein